MPIRLPKQTAQDWLKQCEDSQSFRVVDGKIARSVKDLATVLGEMSEQTFRYHVNQNKNDFANWAEGVFKNYHLSASLRKARSLNEAYQYAKRHYLMLERNLRDVRIKEERKNQNKYI